MLLQPAAGGEINHTTDPLSSLKQELFSDNSYLGHMTDGSIMQRHPPSTPLVQMLGNNMADEFNNGGTMLLLCC